MLPVRILHTKGNGEEVKEETRKKGEENVSAIQGIQDFRPEVRFKSQTEA